MARAARDAERCEHERDERAVPGSGTVAASVNGLHVRSVALASV
jgi:hypothetical protein